MATTTITFDNTEERTELNAAIKATDMAMVLFKLQSFARYLLNKEERENIPCEEVAKRIMYEISSQNIIVDELIE